MSAPVGTKTDKEIGVAVLGLGNVGSEVVRIIDDSAADLCARVGAPLVVRGIGVRRIADDRGVPTELLTDNIEGLVSREDVDIVVEVMGPVEPARKAILSALEQGKSVVTANKALMAVVGFPRPVNPRRGLAVMAAEQGWPVLRVSAPGRGLLGSRRGVIK